MIWRLGIHQGLSLPLVLVDLLGDGVELVLGEQVAVDNLVGRAWRDKELVVELRAWSWVDASVVHVPVPLELVKSLEDQLPVLGANL